MGAFINISQESVLADVRWKEYGPDQISHRDCNPDKDSVSQPS